MGGGVEAIYDDMAAPTGFARFAPARPARGAMFSARHRAGRDGALTVAPVIPEPAYYTAADPAGQTTVTKLQMTDVELSTTPDSVMPGGGQPKPMISCPADVVTQASARSA
jgi:hypothetical protein